VNGVKSSVVQKSLATMISKCSLLRFTVSAQSSSVHAIGLTSVDQVYAVHSGRVVLSDLLCCDFFSHGLVSFQGWVNLYSSNSALSSLIAAVSNGIISV
jgi:hypothetical protein